MKNLLFTLCISFVSLTSCNNNKKQWAEYNNAIVSEMKTADSVIQQLFTFKDFEKYESAKSDYINALANAKKNLLAIEAPEAGDSLRTIAIEITDVYTEIASKDFYAIYTFMHDSIYTPADSISVDSLSDIMYSKWQIASEKFATRQKEFSRDYGINLE